MTNEEKMTPEEAIAEISFLKVAVNKVMEQALEMAIKALSQEPSEDMTTAYLMGYYADKEPCDDAISRDAVYSILKEYHIDEEEIESAMDDCQNLTVNGIASDVSLLPSVTQKSGKWIEDAKTYYEELNKRGLGVDEYTPYFTDDIACSECLAKYNTIDNETQFFKYCPNCGARMESEDKE